MHRSLNSVLTWIGVTAAAIGLIVLAALMLITSAMHVVSLDLMNSAETIRAVDSIQVQILLNKDATTPIVKGATRAGLLQATEQTARLVTSPEEKQQLQALRAAVDAYVGPDAGGEELGAAWAAAHRIALLTLERAATAQRRAASWNRIANVGSVVTMILVVAAVAAAVLWLRRGPFRRITAISHAMQRFSAGELDARAPVEGRPELAEIARTFNGTATELVRARRRQVEYVATAMHALRTPLAALQLALGYVSVDRPIPKEPRLRALFDLMGRQLQRLNGLVGDVLSATWLDAGELRLLMSRFDLRGIASDSVRLFQELAPDHLIDLALPSQPTMLEGDRVRLEQVINNLLSNAVKYSPFGSRIAVEVGTIDDQAVLSVSDEGEGITEEDRAHIFDTFRRGSATHAEAPGTSLGLWVSRRVVESHGGRIELESRVGQGSRFRVFLPASTAPPEQTATGEGAGAGAAAPGP